MDTRKIATLTGWLMVVTFVTSIPAYFILYAPVRDNPNYITGAGADPTASVALGAVLELILIIANVGTAVVPYAVFKRYSEGLALGYVAARLVEATFIAIGIISLLAFLFMRQEGATGTDAALGEAFVAIYDRAFLIGPGFFAGVANGMILGYLMYRSGLVHEDGDTGAHRRPTGRRLGSRRHVRRHRARVHAAGPRDDSGVHLGVVVRYLPHRQGIQAVSDSG
jgi:hypothetical protein